MVTKKLQDKAFIKYNIENIAQFNAALDEVKREASDLRTAFKLIAADWRKSQKTIFQLKSRGGYTDLSERYKKQKKKNVGFLYPILRGATGNLEDSVTKRTDSNHVEIVTKQNLIIGTSIPYGVFHNSHAARKKIPQRKFVFIGPESREFSQKDRKNQGGRLTRWSKILKETTEEILFAKGFK